MDNGEFYDYFHKNSKIQPRIIDENNFTYRNIIDALRGIIKEKSQKILDYGCGSGTIAFYLSSQGHKVIGLDISKVAINSARENALKLNLNGCEFYPLKEGLKRIRYEKFDTILCIEVIEHIQNDLKLLIYLNSRLKRGGYLVISTPSINAPLFRIGVLNEFDKRVGHLRRYSETRLVHLLEKSRFKIEKIIRTEGAFRNSLYTLRHLGLLIKSAKGIISDLFTVLDRITLSIFGESDYIVIAQKP